MNFKYRAYGSGGKEDNGETEGRNRQDALRQLASRGLSVVHLSEAKPQTGRPGADSAKPARFGLPGKRLDPGRLFADLALLTEAGLTVTQSLRSMRSTETAPAQRQAIAALMEKMSAGTSAAVSFSAISTIQADSLGLIASGENAGRLPDVFRALATQHEERAKLKSLLVNALSYPAFLLVLMLLAVLVLTFVLVPALEPVFENSQAKAPLIVAALSALRRSLSSGGALLVFLVLLLAALASLLPKPRAMLAGSLQRLFLRLPFAGPIMRKTAIARYLSSFALLIGNGAAMAKALELSAVCATIPSYRARLFGIRDAVSVGQRLPAALQASGLFDERIIALIAVGDEANRLPVVAKRAAQILETAVQTATARYAAMLTPIMTIVMGILIGGLAVSVMTALLSINEIAVQ
jgi:general secretion pathway protein F